MYIRLILIDILNHGKCQSSVYQKIPRNQDSFRFALLAKGKQMASYSRASKGWSGKAGNAAANWMALASWEQPLAASRIAWANSPCEMMWFATRNKRYPNTMYIHVPYYTFRVSTAAELEFFLQQRLFSTVFADPFLMSAVRPAGFGPQVSRRPCAAGAGTASRSCAVAGACPHSCGNWRQQTGSQHSRWIPGEHGHIQNSSKFLMIENHYPYYRQLFSRG